MDFIRLTPENLDSEHICCAISNNRDCQVASKKAWLRDRLDEGLVFLKADARGKCFIEYIPAEYAWVPIEADGYEHINCLWVSGQFAGKGYSNELMNACIADAKEKGKLGVSIISSPGKKLPFLADPKYLAHKGFAIADSAEPYFTLMYLPFDLGAPAPKFRPHVKKPHTDGAGFELFYTGGCPYPAKYAPIIEARAKERGVDFKLTRLETREQAVNAPAAWTNYALFKNGGFVTHEVLSLKKFEALIDG